jgi:hypothetical protein
MELGGNVNLAVAAAFGAWLVLTCADACEIVTNEAVQNSARNANNNRAPFSYTDLHFGSDQTASGAAVERAVSATLYSLKSCHSPQFAVPLQYPYSTLFHLMLVLELVFFVILFMADSLLSRVARMSAMAQSSSTGKLTPEYERRRDIASLPAWFKRMRRSAAECDEDARCGKVEMAAAKFRGLKRYG